MQREHLLVNQPQTGVPAIWLSSLISFQCKDAQVCAESFAPGPAQVLLAAANRDWFGRDDWSEPIDRLQSERGYPAA